MSKNGTDLLVDSLILSDIDTRVKAVAKLIASVMLDKNTMELESNIVFGNAVSIAIKSEIKTKGNE